MLKRETISQMLGLFLFLLSSTAFANEGLLVSTYDHRLQSAQLERFLQTITNDIALHGALQKSTQDSLRGEYNDRKTVQQEFLASASAASRRNTLAWALAQFKNTAATLARLEERGGDTKKLAGWRQELLELNAIAAEREIPQEKFRALIDRAYSLLQEVHEELKLKEPGALLPAMETVEGSLFGFDLGVMDQAEAQINDFFLRRWKPEGGPENGTAVSMAARERLARLTLDLYFLHHYPVRDNKQAAKLQGVFDRINEALKKDELLRTAHQLRELQLKLDELRDSKEPVCLDQVTDAGADLLAPEFLQLDDAFPRTGLPSYCQAISTRGMGNCFQGKDTSKRIVIDPGHLGGAFTKDDRDHLGYREGLSNYVTANLLRLLLSQCMGYDKSNIILTRHDVESVGGVPFDKERKPFGEKKPDEHVCAYDDLDFRGAYIAALKPDFFVSVHTDGTPEQRGTIYMPRPGRDVESLMYKDKSKTDASEAAGERLRLGLNHAFYSQNRIGGKSCAEQIGFARKEIGKGYGDYAVFRETPKGVPTLIIEGFSHAPENPRKALVEAFQDGDKLGKNTERAYINGKWHSYHQVLRCYAEGIAIGIAASLGCK